MKTNSEQQRFGHRRIALAISAVAAIVYVIACREGAIHGYYTPAAISMSKNWHNFFYGAYDPSGFISVDKIPGSMWPAALGIKIFGQNTWSVLVPEALASAATVYVMYRAVTEWVGERAGVLAAAIYATSPVVAAVAQVNVPDTWLALYLSLGALWGTKALRDGSQKNLIIAGLWFAAGFQVKMLQGWLVWPGLIVAFLFCAPGTMRSRVRKLCVAGMISLITSLSWILLVTLTPSGSRPFVGGSDGNSAWEMVFGYNGLGRFGWWGGRSFSVPMGGSAGIGRMFNSALYGQIAWLLPLAFVCIAYGAVATWRRPRTDVERAGYLLWGMWLVMHFFVFSYADGIHTFYVVAMAPAIAALVAAGCVKAFVIVQDGRGSVFAPLVALQTVWTLILLHRTSNFQSWLTPVVLLLGLVAAIALVLNEMQPRALAQKVAGIALVASVLITPTVWSFSTLGSTSSINPSAGPAQSGPGGKGGTGGLGAPGGQGGPGGESSSMTGSSIGKAEVAWLKAHNSAGVTYQVAVPTSNGATELIYSGIESIIPMGGWNGSDPAPTLSEFEHLIVSKQLRYVALGSDGGQGDGGQGGGAGGASSGGASAATQRTAWITKNCALVQDTTLGSATLYDCAQ